MYSAAIQHKIIAQLFKQCFITLSLHLFVVVLINALIDTKYTMQAVSCILVVKTKPQLLPVSVDGGGGVGGGAGLSWLCQRSSPARHVLKLMPFEVNHLFGKALNALIQDA